MCANIFALFVYITSVTQQGVYGLDRTLEPGERGADVVRAVISKIVFSNITFTQDTVEAFMRTMAFVETRDGAQPNPSGGGIWNISEDRFDEAKIQLQSSHQIIMELEHHHKQNHIRLMDWDSLVYENLTIPLYSGLLARMIIHLSREQIQDVGDFYVYWNEVFKNRNGDLLKWMKSATNLTENEGICMYVVMDHKIIKLFIIEEEQAISSIVGILFLN